MKNYSFNLFLGLLAAMMFNIGSLRAYQIVELPNVSDLFENPYKERVIDHVIVLCKYEWAVSFVYSEYAKKIALTVKPAYELSGVQNTPGEIVELVVEARYFGVPVSSNRAYLDIDIIESERNYGISGLWTFDSDILATVTNSKITYAEDHVSDNRAVFKFDARCEDDDFDPARRLRGCVGRNQPTRTPIKVFAVGSYFTIDLMRLKKSNPLQAIATLSFCGAKWDFVLEFTYYYNDLMLSMKRNDEDRHERLLKGTHDMKVPYEYTFANVKLFIRNFDAKDVQSEDSFREVFNYKNPPGFSHFEKQKALGFVELMSLSELSESPLSRKYITFANFSTFRVDVKCQTLENYRKAKKNDRK